MIYGGAQVAMCLAAALVHLVCGFPAVVITGDLRALFILFWAIGSSALILAWFVLIFLPWAGSRLFGKTARPFPLVCTLCVLLPAFYPYSLITRI